MPLWKKKAETIPPVESPNLKSSSSYTSSVRSSSNTYIASRDGDLGGSASYSNYNRSDNTLVDKYSRNRGIGDVYTRGDANVDQDRSELFSGYDASRSGSGRFFDGPSAPQGAPGEETEEDIEGIKQQTRFVKQESVTSTRNALRMAREAEETARGTLGRLGDQSEKLANTERSLDVSKGHSQKADDKTDELKQLNRSIFRPVITWNKDAKRAAQEGKIQSRYEEERQEREKAMMDIRESQNRMGRAATYGRGDDESIGGSRQKNESQIAALRAQRSRYQFDATASDDEMEDELDGNLDEIDDIAKRLKAMGTAMGQELDNQNKRIERIEGKAVGLDNRLFRNTERLRKIK
jgi:hypothetical protein